MKWLLGLGLLSVALIAIECVQQPIDLEVEYMFYACDPCTDNYKVLKSVTSAGQRLLGEDVAIRYQGQDLGETSNPALVADREHRRFRIAGTIGWLGHTVEASSVRKL
jgi:hypothetical protein